MYRNDMRCSPSLDENEEEQAWPVPGFSENAWCLVLLIFNLEQDGIVIMIQLRDDLFKFFVQIFFVENDLKIKTFIILILIRNQGLMI